MITAERKAEVIKIILERISEGESLRAVLPIGNELVDRTIFYEWLNQDTELSNQYTRAREERADKIFEDIIDISDDSSGDVKVTEFGEVLNSEFAARSKIRIDARKWMLSKMMPKKYGDKLDVTSGDKPIENKQVFVIGGKTIEF